MRLEQQIKLLSDCGIPLNEGVTVDDLLYSWGREEYEGQPFELLLITMGGELESRLTAREPDERGTSFASDHIWHFDTECIEGPGSYVRIAERMAVLADGDLPLENIADSVDLEQEVAWLSFTLDGVEHRWDARVEDDWVDPAIMSRFADLLEARGTGKKLTYCDLGGQDCLIGCSTAEQLEQLRTQTGMPLEWLD